MTTSIAFLWHMHQPYYKDNSTGIYSMPWVRLHATKAYFDMVSILEDFPDIKVNFNLVPSLLMQLKDYADSNANDLFLDLSKKETDKLTVDDKKFLLWNYFMANWDTMIKPYPRYWELLYKRGVKITEEDINSVVKKYTKGDYRDLQVWFNLTWFGFCARKKYPKLQKLIVKGNNYSDSDKQEILDIQLEIIKQIIPTYKRLQENGQIEISTTPFYHPIMPLVYNTDIAKRSMPWVELPNKFSSPEDVKEQLKMAVFAYKESFGSSPKGLWPSEGSVCPEIIPLIAEQGIEWIATDEEILFKTLSVQDRGEGLFKPYIYCHGKSCIAVIFRDKGLSNNISFDYAKQDGEKAANDLMRNFHNIGGYVGKQGKNALVTIILDGENPWEYYPGGGEFFLRSLYGKLSNDNSVQTTTISKYIQNNPPVEKLSSLYSGSWINHNFDIWIGDPEENTGWKYLGKTREFLKNVEKDKEIPADRIKTAWQNLYAAEGSDWFWWYGDDFFTDCDEEFDTLFRAHLGNVYTALGYEVPEYLKQPIIYLNEVHANRLPVAFISPALDGEDTHFYEWSDAGYYESKRTGRALYKAESYLSGIYFGFDLENLYIRTDPNVDNPVNNNLDLNIYFNIIEPREYQIVFPFKLGKEGAGSFALFKTSDGVNYDKIKDYTTIGINKIFEFSIPFEDLGFSRKDRVRFFVQIRDNGAEMDRYPKRGYIQFSVPDEEFEINEWMA